VGIVSKLYLRAYPEVLKNTSIYVVWRWREKTWVHFLWRS